MFITFANHCQVKLINGHETRVDPNQSRARNSIKLRPVSGKRVVRHPQW